MVPTCPGVSSHIKVLSHGEIVLHHGDSARRCVLGEGKPPAATMPGSPQCPLGGKRVRVVTVNEHLSRAAGATEMGGPASRLGFVGGVRFTAAVSMEKKSYEGVMATTHGNSENRI